MPTGMRNSAFKIRVTLVSGREVKIACTGSTNVVKFKQDLEEKLNEELEETTAMDWFGMRLFHNGVELQDTQSLAEAGVRRNAVLMLVFDDSQPPPLVDDDTDDYF